MFILSTILLILAIAGGVAFTAARRTNKARKAAHEASGKGYGSPDYIPAPAFGIPAALLAVAAIIIGIFTLFYTQDPGEAVVLRSFTGQVVGTTTEAGLHGKSPFDSTISFNIRNQGVQFAKDSTNNPNGPQITVQDADGVTSNVDISVNYSIDPTAVRDIYNRYRTEDAFKTTFIERDIRAVVREVPNHFSTIDLLTKRGNVESAIRTALEKRWTSAGVTVDNVSLQEIRAPQAVTSAYADAQKSQISVTKAKNDLEAAQVSAQQQVAQAKAQAEANKELTKSLTPQVLEQRYIDALGKSGTVFVVPQGSNPLIQLPSK